MIFSKLVLRPRSAREMRSKRMSFAPFRPCRAALSTSNACCFTSLLLAAICSREGLGRAFLNRSKASSAFRILIVSPKAKSSSVRVFFAASNSFFLASQLLSRPAKNFLSCSSVLEVPAKSSFMVSISTPSSPSLCSLASMALWLALISFCLAATSASKSVFAVASALSASLSSFSIVSFICLRMPTISGLLEVSWPWRKEVSWSRSAALMSMSTASRRKTAPVEVCRKP
mmetsp:Transcript_47806/g.138205  ORF Transcript_47806/g.138205 Transcript_47806/m.138205 type:complete len:230 (-) Transcript_47806:576-1265(-)